MSTSEHTDVPARVSIDESICIGAGSCTRLAPGAFQIDSSREVAELGDLSAVDREQLRQAERSCPTGAIFLEEETPH